MRCTIFDDTYQVMAHLVTNNEKLYINHSVSPETPVTVSVERDGEYLVSIFSVREGMGMLGSGEGYSQLVMVTPLIVSTTAAQKNYIFTTPGNCVYMNVQHYNVKNLSFRK